MQTLYSMKLFWNAHLPIEALLSTASVYGGMVIIYDPIYWKVKDYTSSNFYNVSFFPKYQHGRIDGLYPASNITKYNNIIIIIIKNILLVTLV